MILKLKTLKMLSEKKWKVLAIILGYRAMQRKIREQHQLPVTRNIVYDVMTMVDTACMLGTEKTCGQKENKKRGYWKIHLVGNAPINVKPQRGGGVGHRWGI
jgi:hypothetical protein